MIISVSNKDKETLKDLSKYIWWQDSDYAINHNTLRLIASAMCLANNVEDFIKVIDKMTECWLSNGELEQYLRPITLFGDKFEDYLYGDWERQETDWQSQYY